MSAAKIALSTVLVIGIWYAVPVSGAALAMGVLMAGAQYSHWHVGHAGRAFVPSLVLLVLSLFVSAVHAAVLQ